MRVSSDRQFLFSLGGVVTREPLLPFVARRLDRAGVARELIQTWREGVTPFADSLRGFVALVHDEPATRLAELAASVPINEQLVAFIRDARDRATVVTSLPELWVAALSRRIGLPVVASSAVVDAGGRTSLREVIRKSSWVRDGKRTVVVGNSADDTEMLDAAAIGIAFGGSEAPLTCSLDVCSHAIYDEGRLCRFLRQL